MKSFIRLAHRDEQGQMAFFMLLMLMVVAIFFALALDAGFWYFDHRQAQNQAEAAALAGAQELPAASSTTANTIANTWLDRNGSSASERYGAGEDATGDSNSDGKVDTFEVCVRRDSGIFFSALADITNVKISACATVMAGPVDGSNVMPWGVVAPDPECDADAGRNCLYDANGNGNYADPGDCNAAFSVCPFGLTADRLYAFKQNDTGGNLGMLRVCGSGVNNYRECLSGAAASGFFEVGDTVEAGVQSGTSPNATQDLKDRLPASAWLPPGGTVCDVSSRPDSFGYDPDGKQSAVTKFVNPTTQPQCEYRLVPIPIIDHLPSNGFADVTVLGVASFGVANWKRTNGASAGSAYFGTPSADCRTYPGAPPAGSFPCGHAWGYLFTGVTPPNVLLQSIGESNNPFAPILIALVD